MRFEYRELRTEHGGHAGHCIYDRREDRWLCAPPTANIDGRPVPYRPCESEAEAQSLIRILEQLCDEEPSEDIHISSLAGQWRVTVDRR